MEPNAECNVNVETTNKANESSELNKSTTSPDKEINCVEEMTANVEAEPSEIINQSTSSVKLSSDDPNMDLEDGEIEDDDDDDEDEGAIPDESISSQQRSKDSAGDGEQQKYHRHHQSNHDNIMSNASASKRHLTEAEKSVLQLKRRERLQRDKWEKYHREMQQTMPIVASSPHRGGAHSDDFAGHIEKAIASVLKKDGAGSAESMAHNEPGVERLLSRKRRGTRETDNQKVKARRNELNNSRLRSEDELEQGEMCGQQQAYPALSSSSSATSVLTANNSEKDYRQSHSDSSQYYSDAEYSSDHSGTAVSTCVTTSRKKRTHRPGELGKNSSNNHQYEEMRIGGGRHDNNNTNNNSIRNKNKDTRKKLTLENQLKDAAGVCVFFLQGKCSKNDCPYSHAVIQPMKLELCKFYLMDCCAKGENCYYMHEEFPCKYYHTGMQCFQGDNCKFAHGKPLSEGLKQILYKHIETAPREILGTDFPRPTRDEAMAMINTQQQILMAQYGIVGGTNSNSLQQQESGTSNNAVVQEDKKSMSADGGNRKKDRQRTRPSRWQNAPPVDGNSTAISSNFGAATSFSYGDQDMRISTNGDVDMRTLAPPIATSTSASSGDVNQAAEIIKSGDQKDIDERPDEVIKAHSDIDIRQLPFSTAEHQQSKSPHHQPSEDANESNELSKLPKVQQDLYVRIQSQQKDPADLVLDSFDLDNADNINWYSDEEEEEEDDDDDNRLTIQDDNSTATATDNTSVEKQQEQQQQPAAVVEKLGDLSKIDISAQVTKLLSTITNRKSDSNSPSESSASAPKVSIYDQGNLNSRTPSPEDETTWHHHRPDVDMRNLRLPFKGMLNYTPAKEIDASLNSHGVPMSWKILPIEIPRPDYTGLKLSAADAEKTGDPRLRKIFRLTIGSSCTIEESPASPPMNSSSSPKAVSVRSDPRLKKAEDAVAASRKQQPPPEAVMLNYNQQLTILQSSQFFQSLTSNQKLLLNQELAARSNPSGLHDPILHSLLANLNLIPSVTATTVLPPPLPPPPQLHQNANLNAALSILSTVSNLNSAPNLVPAVNTAANRLNSMCRPPPGLLPPPPAGDYGLNNVSFLDPRGILPPTVQSMQVPPPGLGTGQQCYNPANNNSNPNMNSATNQYDEYYRGNPVDSGGGFHPHNSRGGGFHRDRRRGGGGGGGNASRSNYPNRNKSNFRNKTVS